MKVLTRVMLLLGLLVLILAVVAGAGMLTRTSNTLASLETEVAQQQVWISYQATQILRQEEMIEYLATRGPAGRFSQPLTISPTPTPFRPVTGAVVIHNGGCCMGGLAGEMIDVDVRFEAYSVNGEVNEMRVLTGVTSVSEEDMDDLLWEPFVPEMNFSVKLATNWTAFWVHVQYRDETGVLSEIYSDDISLEGHPPTPTPTQ